MKGKEGRGGEGRVREVKGKEGKGKGVTGEVSAARQRVQHMVMWTKG